MPAPSHGTRSQSRDRDLCRSSWLPTNHRTSPVFAGRPGVEIMQVGAGRDSADFAMVPPAGAGGHRGDRRHRPCRNGPGPAVAPLSPRGHEYLPATIDAELAVRHAEQRHRRAGGRTTGPTPFQDQDRERFREVLARLLTENAGAPSGEYGSPRHVFWEVRVRGAGQIERRRTAWMNISH